MALANVESKDLFEEYKHSAFRWESLPVYTIPKERGTFDRFLAGEPMPDDFNMSWRTTVRGYIAAGKTMQRVKVFRWPLTDYSRYMYEWALVVNSAAGEDYRILDLTDRTFEVPAQDFWLFDDETVLLLNFNEDGTLRNRELADPADLDQYRRWRDLALSAAVPWSEYRLQHPSSRQ